MTGKTVEAQATPDPMPLAGQRPGPPYFAILIVAGMFVIGAGLQATASIVAPIFLVITLVITVAPLRTSPHAGIAGRPGSRASSPCWRSTRC